MRAFCGKHITVEVRDVQKTFSIEVLVEFEPNAPVIRKARFDTYDSSLKIELEKENSGECALRYEFGYYYNGNDKDDAQFTAR